MNISPRLRTCARHTGLDAVIELLQEAADEIDAMQASAQVQGEPVYQYRHADGSWSDQTRASYDYNVEHGATNVRVLYTTTQPTQATQDASAEDMKVYNSIADRYFREATQAEVTDVFIVDCAKAAAPEASSLDAAHIAKFLPVWRKFARAILALRTERVPMTDEALWTAVIEHLGPEALSGGRMSILDAFHLGITVAEAHHGITAQAKKEDA